MAAAKLSRKKVWAASWPLIFANALIPLVGVIDTAVISIKGDASDLAGVALGATVFAIFYWGTYSLRQSTTGLAAQAEGRGSQSDSQLVLLRSLLLGLALGLLVLVLARPLQELALGILQGSTKAESIAGTYVYWRFFGAPAAIALFAVTGWMIGAGLPRMAMWVQSFMALANALFDFWLVIGLNMGAAGVAIGTSIAEWLALLLGLGLAGWHLAHHKGLRFSVFRHPQLFNIATIKALLFVNGDLMIRSMCMVAGFTWFINSGAKQSDAMLAGNQILLQFITVWAFVLDAFAYTAEAETGRAIGRRSKYDLLRAIRLTSEFAFLSAAVCSVLTMVAGPHVLGWLVQDQAVLSAALHFLPWCAIVPLLGVAAWQLDGIFVGATLGAIMRNGAIVSLMIYLAADFWLAPSFGNGGVWTAFLLYYIARALTLLAGIPALMRAVQKD